MRQTSVSGRPFHIIFPGFRRAGHRVYTEEASPSNVLCTSFLARFSSLKLGISRAMVSTRGLLARVTSVTHFVLSWENDIPVKVLAKNGFFGMPLWWLKWESGAWMANNLGFWRGCCCPLRPTSYDSQGKNRKGKKGGAWEVRLAVAVVKCLAFVFPALSIWI